MFGFGITYLLALFKLFPKNAYLTCLGFKAFNFFFLGQLKRACQESAKTLFTENLLQRFYLLSLSIHSQKIFSWHYFQFLSQLSPPPFQNVSVKNPFDLAKILSADSEYLKRCLMLFRAVNMQQCITRTTKPANDCGVYKSQATRNRIAQCFDWEV